MKKIFNLFLILLFLTFTTACVNEVDVYVNLKTTDFQLVEGDTKELLFELTDKDNSGVTFTSSDDAVLTVSTTGVVTANSAGVATVTVTAVEDTTKSVTVDITVIKDVAVSFTTPNSGVLEGNTLQLVYVLVDNDNLGVTFTSSDDAILTVSTTGLVTSVSDGVATVTVTAVEDTTKSATVDITVSKDVIVLSTTKDSTIGNNDTLQLVYSLVDNDNLGVTFTSSDDAILTVSATGLVTAVSEGVATVTITSVEDATKSATVSFTVLKDVTLSFTTEDSELENGNTLQLVYSLIDNDSLSVTFTSSDEGVLTVSSTGLVTAVSGGVATVTVASVEDVTKTATIEITVLLDATLTFTTEDSSIGNGNTLQLVYSLVDNDSLGVTFTSSDEDVLTVSATGLVTAVSSGAATVTVTSVEDPTSSATVEITVLGDLAQGYFVDANATEGEFRQVGSEFLIEGINLFMSINDALSSVDSSSQESPVVINILAGTYTENVIVDLDYVILSGPNSNINPNTSTRGNEAIITGQIKISDSSYVLITGLSFEGVGQVTIDKTTTVDTFEFINNVVSDNTSDAVILFDYEDATNNVTNVKISNNLFDTLTGRAWYIYFSKNIQITENKVLSVSSDNKIYGSYGIVDVIGNEFANMGHRAVHIVGFTDGLITVNENYMHDSTVAQAPIAIWSYYAYSESVVIEANYNVLENVGKGLYIDMSYKNDAGSWVCDITTDAHANYNIIENVGNGSYVLGSAGCHTPNFNYNYFGLDDISSMVTYRTDVATIGTDFYTSRDQIVYPNGVYVVSLTATDGDTIDFLGETRIYGEDYFSSINDALSASRTLNSLKNVEIYLLEGTYEEDFTIRQNNISIYGPNKDINPLTDTRVDEAILTGLVFLGNGDKVYTNIAIDGLKFTEGAQLRANVSKSVNHITISNNIAEDIVYPSTNSAAAFLMFDTTSKANAANNIVVQNNKFVNMDSYSYASAFLIKYASNIDFIGNYFENTKYYNSIIGSDGFVNVIGNEFNAVQNKALTIKNFVGGFINVSDNYFHDWTVNQQAIAIYAGPQYEVNTTVIANYNRFSNVGKGIYMDMSYKNSAGAWVSDIPVTAEANYNVFENVTGSYYLGTDSADTANFKWNYFNGLTDLSTMGVHRVGIDKIGSDFYTDKSSVPTYTELTPVAPTTITIDNSETELPINAELQMTYTIDEAATNKIVRWSTSDSNIATIDPVLGILLTHGFGEITVYATSMIDDSVIAEYTITVRMDDMLSISTEGNPSSLLVGDSITLTANTLPVLDVDVEWSTSDPTIATVDTNGVVTTLKAGVVEISATYANDITVSSIITLQVIDDLSITEDNAQSLLNYLSINQKGYVNFFSFDVIGWEGNYHMETYDSVSDYYFDSLTVNTQLIPEGNGNRPGEGMNTLPEGVTQYNDENVHWVVIHDTASSSETADAGAHANYVDNADTSTSWHFTIDDEEIWQHLPTNERAYHAGDGSTNVGEGDYLGGGNRNGIGIEMAVNEGSDIYRTWQRTAKEAAALLIQYNLPLDHQVYHNDMSGKQCPNTLLTAGLSDTFKSFVAAEFHIQSNFAGATITFTSNNPDVLDNTGRIISSVEEGTTVSYTIDVTYNGETVSKTFYTYVSSDLIG
jgi:N-acetylmuramoyl-L-alanine amidase